MMDEGEQEGLLGKVDRWTRVENTLARQALAEFLGTFVLIMIGNGAVAEVVLSSGTANNFFSINIAYGLAVAFGMYLSVGISGGHLNPAISVTFCCLGKLQWRRLPAYLGAQYLGCLCGSALVFGIYYDALVHLDGGRRITDPALPNATAGIWASYPQPHISWQNGFVDQARITFGSSILSCHKVVLERSTLKCWLSSC
ncbi:AQP4 [Ramazzottius varieornatus]|uniref:AQP4 n=1 Tax=Ramazzottius varieornatus TaxID=947166 RepID=A0A1D1UE37_RAMVA|nr:AQP4 [Ramazzottius varieornatus]